MSSYCTICQFECEEGVSLQCGCKFHGQCIVEYLERGKVCCPNCRHEPVYGEESMESEYDEEGNSMYRSVVSFSFRCCYKRLRKVAKGGNKKVLRRLRSYDACVQSLNELRDDNRT